MRACAGDSSGKVVSTVGWVGLGWAGWDPREAGAGGTRGRDGIDSKWRRERGAMSNRR